MVSIILGGTVSFELFYFLQEEWHKKGFEFFLGNFVQRGLSVDSRPFLIQSQEHQKIDKYVRPDYELK